ncbi:MAG: hypothetical protein U9R75_09575 [Candidatus Thermoplasmatota archaeon]|nr:hypothetical protein [Candidatus Thermoplasmatota archaeon]
MDLTVDLDQFFDFRIKYSLGERPDLRNLPIFPEYVSLVALEKPLRTISSSMIFKRSRGT